MSSAQRRTVRVLSVAGSDSGGGAGIQGDLRALARCGVFATTAITAVTAQNTSGVEVVHQVPPEVIAAQIRAVLGDIGADAVKIGMLGGAPAVEAVADALAGVDVPIVLDPVLVSSSGAPLLDDAGRSALVARLMPAATVVTPNVPEARVLAGDAEHADDTSLARAVLALGPGAILLTGGHRERPADLLLAGGDPVEIPFERVDGTATHGSGCTHSAALAARLALGDDLLAAARVAQRIAAEAIRNGHEDLGRGPGPVDALAFANAPSPPRGLR